jgi:hypothetical protein
MSSSDRDAIGRKQPSKYLRQKRARTAARHRWKHKWQLLPGEPIPWNHRSFENELRSRALSKQRGQKIANLHAEQRSLFWRWYHGDCKEHLHGPFKTVVETFERTEAAYVQRYGRRSPKWEAWEGFTHYVFKTYILRACWKMDPEAIERDMWARYEQFMTAEGMALVEMLRPMIKYEEEREERILLAQAYAQLKDDEQELE